MESKTLFKTGDVEVQQSSRGAISFGYTDSTAAMFDLYARIAELEEQLSECSEYLIDGESPADCIERKHYNEHKLMQRNAGLLVRRNQLAAEVESLATLRVTLERDQLAAQNERVRKIIGGTPKYSSDEDDLEEIESAMDEAWKILNESPAASLAEIQASAVNGFAQEVGVFDPGYDDQEYVEIPRYKVREYIESLRQQQGFTCKHGTILYGTSCLNCDCERAQESHS